uniref:Uncharacterized protein n=1 Tax=Tetranychus urticae TaxID=32264 RepID=T1KVI2_TETUR
MLSFLYTRLLTQEVVLNERRVNIFWSSSNIKLPDEHLQPYNVLNKRVEILNND